jgi:alpha/beta superfamily hydrolase
LLIFKTKFSLVWFDGDIMAERCSICVSSSISLRGWLTRSIPDQAAERIPRYGDLALVLTHPHSNLGGDMNNNVVEYLFGCFQQTGWFNSILRFNFRGVGGSTGSSSWTGKNERQDVIAACNFLLQLPDPPSRILLVG